MAACAGARCRAAAESSSAPPRQARPTGTCAWKSSRSAHSTLQAGAQAGGYPINGPFTPEGYLERFARKDRDASVANTRPDEGRLPMMRQLDEPANSVARQYGQNSQPQTTTAHANLTRPDSAEGIRHAPSRI